MAGIKTNKLENNTGILLALREDWKNKYEERERQLAWKRSGKFSICVGIFRGVDETNSQIWVKRFGIYNRL